jgi:hypothetical protein
MKALDLIDEGGERLRLERIVFASEEASHVSHQARHVPKNFGWRAHFMPWWKIAVMRGRVAKRLLGSVGNGGEKMLQQLLVAIGQAVGHGGR